MMPMMPYDDDVKDDNDNDDEHSNFEENCQTLYSSHLTFLSWQAVARSFCVGSITMSYKVILVARWCSSWNWNSGDCRRKQQTICFQLSITTILTSNCLSILHVYQLGSTPGFNPNQYQIFPPTSTALFKVHDNKWVFQIVLAKGKGSQCDTDVATCVLPRH